MGLGDSWSDATIGSASKLNKVTVISGTGTYVTSLDKANHILFRADDTTGGLTANHLYMCSADGLSLIDVTDVDVHDHSSTSSGGTLLDITKANPDIHDSGGYFLFNPRKGDWVETVSGTGSVADDVDGTTGESSIKLATGGTNASTSSIRMPGIDFDVSKTSWFKSMIRLSSTAAIAFRVGVDMDNLSGADSNQRQYGAEGCTTVNGNFFLRTATGSARSASDSGTAFTTNRTSVGCEHFPDIGTPKVDLYINQGTAFTKTTNIPTSYANDEPLPNNVFRQNVKNNTGADKQMFCYGVRLVYQSTSDWA